MWRRLLAGVGIAVVAAVVLLVTSSSAGSGTANPIFWYVSRAAAFTAYLLFFVNVVLGLGISTKFMDDLMARWRLFDVHQFTALVGLGFLGLHVGSLLGDQYMHFNLGQVLVPFTSPYRPLWVALGIISLYVLVAVVASYYVKKWIGAKAWRALHYVTFVAFWLILAHGVLSGSDSGQFWAKLIYWGSGLTVLALTATRFFDRKSAKPSGDRPTSDRGSVPGGKRDADTSRPRPRQLA